MKLFAHYTFTGFSNSYLIGPDQGGEAVLIDPGFFNVSLLKMVEDSGFDLSYILITHAHESHISALRTIFKIYSPSLFSANPKIHDQSCEAVREGEPLTLGEFPFSVLATPGHSPDSVTYVLGRYLFTGDTLFAGSIGSTHDEISRALLVSSIRGKILTLEDDYTVFPGHGPPTTVGIERRLNPEIQERY